MTMLCVLCGVARADDVEDARRHVRNGARAFELGELDEAIREYTAAYKLKDVPAILYNLAQAHRLANHPSEALHFYKMYLTKVPDAPNRVEVSAKIDALVTLVEQQRQAEVIPPPVAPAAPPVVVPVAAPTRNEKPPRKRAWIWGVVGGVVVVGVGIGLGVGLGLQSRAPNATEGAVRF
jgi:hypothetical protein